LINSRVRIIVPAALASLLALTALPAAGSESDRGESPLGKINHIVVIYQENHSFDNLYGGWEGVNGLANADAPHTVQIKQDGTDFACLLQNDVNLANKLPADCHDTTGTPATATSPGNTPFASHFGNSPFQIDASIPATARTCPHPSDPFSPTGYPDSPAYLPGGCTRDMVHRFYQEQFQLNNGQQNRYTAGSDAVGLTQGYYNTQALPIYQYLHQEDHPKYAIADNFFQAAFGGSFLNHQWLIAATTPTWTGAPLGNHSIIDTNGMPNKYALYTPTGPILDRQLTQLCPSAVPGRACGDRAINTIQPAYQPFKGSPQLPPQTGRTIGDELSDAGVSWAWYSGGWSNADGDVGAPGWTNGTTPGVCADPDSAPNPTYPNCPNKVFQFHHQPFNYYAAYAPKVGDIPAAPGRAHLRDEAEFLKLAQTSTDQQCKLNSVSFVKPIGLENEHPGYTSESAGSSHLVELLKAIEGSACRKDTMVITTYDEFGGSWDHVPPPGQGDAEGPHDEWGPGTRIPALVIAPRLPGSFVVDSLQHDTTSILTTIEHRFGLLPVGTRDAAVTDLSSVFRARVVGD
jgi:phospholipase C